MIEPIALLSPIYVTFFWGVVFLFSSAGTDKAKQMLSVFMFAACGLYISHGVFFIGSPMLYFRIEPIYLFVNLSVYPLYYFYIRLLTAEETLSVKHLIWLLPALTMSLLSWLIGFYFDDNEAQAYVENFLIQRNLHFLCQFYCRMVPYGVIPVIKVDICSHCCVYPVQGHSIASPARSQCGQLFFEPAIEIDGLGKGADCLFVDNFLHEYPFFNYRSRYFSE
jgi:hypothetical protein